MPTISSSKLMEAEHWVLITLGRVEQREQAPIILERDDMRPLKKSALLKLRLQTARNCREKTKAAAQQ